MQKRRINLYAALLRSRCCGFYDGFLIVKTSSINYAVSTTYCGAYESSMVLRGAMEWLNEKRRADVEVLSKCFSLRFTDTPFSVEGFRGDSL